MKQIGQVSGWFTKQRQRDLPLYGHRDPFSRVRQHFRIDEGMDDGFLLVRRRQLQAHWVIHARVPPLCKNIAIAPSACCRDRGMDKTNGLVSTEVRASGRRAHGKEHLVVDRPSSLKEFPVQGTGRHV